MPIPAKLKAPELKLDLDSIRLNLQIYRTTCEVDDCTVQADNFLRTRWSFIWVCTVHHHQVSTMPLKDRGTWERHMAEVMYDRMLVFNFMHQNMISDFALQAQVDERLRVQQQIASEQSKLRNREQREMRAMLASSDSRAGMPDEELLVARQRQAQRVLNGTKPLGTPARDRLALLKPKLIVPMNKLLVDPQES